MSTDERLARIENVILELRAEMASKADLAEVRAEMATKADLAEVRAEMATKADLAEVRAEMATKADLAEVRTEMATKADLARSRAEIEADPAEIRAEMATKTDLAPFATKADLAAAFAEVAKNVDVTALGRLVRQSINDTAMLRGEVRMLTATSQQLVGTVGGFANLLQALVDQQQRLDDRVRVLEDERQP